MQTYLPTDWLELGDSTMVKVVLTDESEAYLISVTNANGKPEAELFKLDARKLRRKDFFNAVMDAWREAFHWCNSLHIRVSSYLICYL